MSLGTVWHLSPEHTCLSKICTMPIYANLALANSSAAIIASGSLSIFGPCPWALEGLPPPLPPRAAKGPFTQSPALSRMHKLLGTPAHASALPLPASHVQNSKAATDMDFLLSFGLAYVRWRLGPALSTVSCAQFLYSLLGTPATASAVPLLKASSDHTCCLALCSAFGSQSLPCSQLVVL